MKKIISILLILLLIVSIVGGCSNEQSQTDEVNEETGEKTGEVSEGDTEEKEEELVNNTYKTGYPIVKDKITLRAVVSTGSHVGPMQEMIYWKKLEELTNIHIEFEHITQNNAEKISLIFASRDFPDIMFNGPNDKQIMDAAAAGDVIPLDDLIKEYAPNWTKILAENSFAKKVTTMPDGKIYSLPYIHDEDVEKGLRDQWLINVKWLNELGLDIPTTTDEYRQVLRAFKDNAGKGSIPQNAIPWYFRFHQYVGGEFDIYGSFGVLVPNSEYVIVEDGKVKFQAINPAIKEPIKYLHELYKEGLIPPEVFTDDWDAYLAKTRSEPPMVGVMHSFHNPDLTGEIWKAMPPVKAPGVDKPLYRQQTNRVGRHYFCIFSNNKYPEASIRLADTLAEKDWSIQGKFGIYGEHILKTEDGSLKIAPGVGEEDFASQVPLNHVCLALTRDIFEKFIYEGQRLLRANAYEMYKPYIPPLESFYPPVVFTQEQVDKKAELSTDILGYIKETIAHWIVDGGIDNEWDAYVEKLNEMGLEELIQIYQEALDTFNQG